MDTREDARLCLEHGIDGILVSNHGGRATETLRATLEALPEVVAEVGNRIRVFVAAASAAAPMYSRPSRLARRPLGSAARSCGDSERSAKPASIACSKSCKAS